MTMARRFGLATPSCLLLELADGALCYVVRRFDRFLKGRRVEKLLCEDMHQILGGPDKYAGSHEQIAAALLKIREHRRRFIAWLSEIAERDLLKSADEDFWIPQFTNKLKRRARIEGGSPPAGAKPRYMR